MNQREKREYLIRALLKEQHGSDISIPSEETEQRRLLRSLFNIRMPKESSEEFLKIQDEYLQETIREKGITDIQDLKPVIDDMYLWKGDITTLRCDAIVNAANSQMLGCFVPCHKCIDNAIHTYAGIQLRQECSRKMNELRSRYGSDYEQPMAVAMITNGYNLPSRKVIHVVGPVIYDEVRKEDEELLSSCYESCLRLADENGLRSIAFCCISTGEFRFPNRKAARIAIDTVRKYKSETKTEMKVIFNVYKDSDDQIYRELLG